MANGTLILYFKQPAVKVQVSISCTSAV